MTEYQLGRHPQENPKAVPSSLEELAPAPSIIDALRGTISDPVTTISHKSGSEGQEVEVRLVEEGAGMYGLTDWRDNKLWSGMFNHSALAARYAGHFAVQMREKGATDPQRVVNTHYVSHAGRRTWEEALYYPEAVQDAEVKAAKSNETIGMEIVQGKVPDDVFELVVALGHNVEGFAVDPAVYDSLDYRVAIYADHRTTQKYEPLDVRMAGFLLQNFFDGVDDEKRAEVTKAIGKMIELRKKDATAITVEEADIFAGHLGANESSPRLARRDLMRLILQDADTEAFLIQNGIDPDAVNDETVPMPTWEDALRREYVLAAKESIVLEVYGQIAKYQMYVFTDGEHDDFRFEALNKEFPINSWWGKPAREAFYEWFDNDEALVEKRKSDVGYQYIQTMVEEKFKRPDAPEDGENNVSDKTQIFPQPTS